MPIACGVSRLNHNHPLMESGELTGVFTLDNGAWTVTNWEAVLSRVLRGEDLLIPQAHGVEPRGRKRDILDASIQMAFDGNVDRTGASYAPNDVVHGLEKNRAAFIAGAVNPPGTTNNLFTLSLTLNDGTVVSGSIHTESFRFSYSGVPGIGLAVWRITLPDGRLT